jgi:phosphate starvation-inducible protein PhoH and related proteins
MTSDAKADEALTTTTYVANTHLMAGLLGARDEHLRVVERSFPNSKIRVQGNQISVTGPDAATVLRLFDELVLVLESGQTLDTTKIARTIDMVADDLRPSEVLRHEVVRGAKGKTIRPSTAGQKRYTDAIDNNIITFGVGPAGTGKSYLAVAQAVQALHRRQVQRIVLTRPAVEAGENLGFLPGDLMAKVDPYLRPLYDALYDMVGADGAQRLIGNGTIEVAPLAFMRGRTLNDSFIILDEAQNTTPEQMKMFLTRIGFNSKAVVTGDVTQIDLNGKRSGMLDIERILTGVEGISFIHLGTKDVVRHRIVADIVAAYERSTLVLISTRLTSSTITTSSSSAGSHWLTEPSPTKASGELPRSRSSSPTSRRSPTSISSSWGDRVPPTC